MKKKSRRTKIALAVAAGLLAVPVVVLVVLLNFDWNRAKPWLNARTSEALGRLFAIAGDLITRQDGIFEHNSGRPLLHASFSRCVMIGCIRPRNIQGPDRDDRHSFLIERMDAR